ncbi:hypothetical protein Q8A67_000245 [Cirrhinus molitorella]|uniref:Uncharacterized protein n=1 Tax=Cirrhinus molitorella TaxID=172907 RepID=A0AA88Q7T0_9TELE|nr:hypothetical protein Q8A67_000245 [Cirrhinus molitorella]
MLRKAPPIVMHFSTTVKQYQKKKVKVKVKSLTLDDWRSQDSKAENTFTCCGMKSSLIQQEKKLKSLDGSTAISVKRKRAASPVSGCVSMKSNNSIVLPPNLSDGHVVTSESVDGRVDQIRYVSCQTFTSSYCQNHISHPDTEADLQLDSHHLVHDDLQRVKDQHKTSMKSNSEFKPLTPERAGSELQSPRRIRSEAAQPPGKTQCGSWRRVQDQSRTPQICL